MTESEWRDARQALFPEFTDAAQQVLDEAVPLARMEGRRLAVFPVLVLVCVLRRWNKGGRVGLEALQACGIDRRAMEDDALEEVEAADREPGTDPDYEPVGRVAALAKELSAAQGRNYVGTEHLVMALLAMGGAALSRLFTRHGVTLQRFQEKVVELLGC